MLLAAIEATNFRSLSGKISEATFYSWKKKYGELDPAELRRLRQCPGLRNALCVTELKLAKHTKSFEKYLG